MIFKIKRIIHVSTKDYLTVYLEFEELNLGALANIKRSGKGHGRGATREVGKPRAWYPRNSGEPMTEMVKCVHCSFQIRQGLIIEHEI